MAYTFQSRATGDLIMLDAVAEHLLKLLDKTPGASGILTLEQIPAALQTLSDAVQADDAQRQSLAQAAASPDASTSAEAAEAAAQLSAVSLRQRVAPLAEMLRRSADADKEVIWHPAR